MELRFGDVCAQRQRIEIRNSVESLTGLNYFACASERREHRSTLGIFDSALAKSVGDLRNARVA